MPNREGQVQKETVASKNNGKKMFIHGLSKHIAALEKLFTGLEQQFDWVQASHIYHIAHTMKGSAPMFGFDSVGKYGEILQNLWEWTQEPKPDQVRDNLLHILSTSITISKGYLLKLKMEYETCVRAIEFHENEDKEKTQSRLQPNGRLLMVDDDNVFRSYLVERLRSKGYEVEGAANMAMAKKMLHEQSFDLITLDLLMQPESGYEMFHFLKEDPTLKWIPLIVLSGRDDIEDKVRCLLIGADDYVVKPFQFDELEARIYRLLMRSQLLEQMAFRDALTGVYNRRYFDLQMHFEIQRAQRNQQNMVIAFIDIDRFKKINDTYGHQMGDLVLQAFGDIMQKNLRSMDLLARYGGEEFIIFFPDTDENEAVSIVIRILRELRRFPIIQKEGRELYLTFSAGVSGWIPNLSTQEWIQLADDAVYQAKKMGRNRVVLSEGNLLAIQDNLEALKKKVLIADDDEMIRSILRSSLNTLPVEICEAEDGEEAIQIIKTEKIDLCILDGVMPKLHGFDVLKWVKSHPSYKQTKIMMLSGLKTEEDVVKGLRLGSDDYLSKPFSLPELEIRVKRLLGML